MTRQQQVHDAPRAPVQTHQTEPERSVNVGRFFRVQPLLSRRRQINFSLIFREKVQNFGLKPLQLFALNIEFFGRGFSDAVFRIFGIVTELRSNMIGQSTNRPVENFSIFTRKKHQEDVRISRQIHFSVILSDKVQIFELKPRQFIELNIEFFGRGFSDAVFRIFGIVTELCSNMIGQEDVRIS
ncbi:hypothetical protein JOB18_016320 [Solea senegalensis]|uniref:Uncharacterized protein n=1 Tax=Solea senegalensis TaxID=28829 RepID=A0AAV6SM27_SOLSE|nr:hypothetical protein JOB18_016320 [Solea senegalensis]